MVPLLSEAVRRLCEYCRLTKAPRIPKEEFDEFWDSRCWLALRQEVAAQIDHYHCGTLAPASSMQTIYECRGAVRALLWLLEAKSGMSGRIAKNIDEVAKYKAQEDRLREILHLIEEEKQNEWNRTKRGKSGDSDAGNNGTTDKGNKPISITLNPSE